MTGIDDKQFFVQCVVLIVNFLVNRDGYHMAKHTTSRVKVSVRVRDTYHMKFEEDWGKNEAEWTRKAELLAAGEARRTIFLPL